MENPIKMDDLGGPPLFLETSIYSATLHLCILSSTSLSDIEIQSLASGCPRTSGALQRRKFTAKTCILGGCDKGNCRKSWIYLWLMALNSLAAPEGHPKIHPRFQGWDFTSFHRVTRWIFGVEITPREANNVPLCPKNWVDTMKMLLVSIGQVLFSDDRTSTQINQQV